ncbi:uncharacterized protein NECHADRAFT_89057 [Fusarium vanettenii 77-13-4]|uniref:Uncharacterized protein n=1 Tax=Fusarium vanettenii (strain ATCC MYA-4622 / CBS 123669 / FGSC 9596 / NRRL 45880 / 77-13-4) TaxID=660122 RepID=C7ZQ24_FUSV7|nr:uncharacterized protein NECHADRAFT_89057 [Fusarium vanettenii 77-13-4]EEU33887.1 predicted protein [Fusarium vanettenii 77-13-4]
MAEYINGYTIAYILIRRYYLEDNISKRGIEGDNKIKRLVVWPPYLRLGPTPAYIPAWLLVRAPDPEMVVWPKLPLASRLGLRLAGKVSSYLASTDGAPLLGLLTPYSVWLGPQVAPLACRLGD